MNKFNYFKRYLFISLSIIIIFLLIIGIIFYFKEKGNYLIIISIPLLFLIIIYFIIYLLNDKMTRRIMILRSYILSLLFNIYLIVILIITYKTNNNEELNLYNQEIKALIITLIISLIYLFSLLILKRKNKKFLKLCSKCDELYDLILESNLNQTKKNDLIKEINIAFKNNDYKALKKIEIEKDNQKDEILNSYFHGNFFKNLLNKIKRKLLLIITLGLAYPYVKCQDLKQEAKCITYDNYNLEFTGTAKGLIFQWLKWISFSILTLGIYSFFIPSKIRKFKACNTHLKNYQNKDKGNFDGFYIIDLLLSFLCLVINIATFFIAIPFTMCLKKRWYYHHLIYDGERLIFIGKSFDLIKKWLLWLALSYITFGIYAIYSAKRIKKWEVSNTHILSIYKKYQENQDKNSKLIKII